MDMPLMPVSEALVAMQELVQAGAMHEASAVGRRAVIPLSLTAQELHIGEIISEGSEGAVYNGVYNGSPVAVKRLKLQTSADLDRFRNELLLLSAINHPNVVSLIGAKALPPDYMLVLRLGAHNLRHMLYEMAWRPPWEVVIRSGAQLASALVAVHDLGVVHRDIKPSNLILAHDGETIMLSDFGLAIPAKDSAPETDEADGRPTAVRGGRSRPSGGKQRMAGTLEYMAPEVLLKQPVSQASDVYSFAVTLNELATAVVPFSDCTKENPEVHTVLEMGYGRQELAAAVAAEGLRPLLPSCGSPPGFDELLADCWHRDPASRPTMTMVAEALEGIRTSIPAWVQAEPWQQRQGQQPAGGGAGPSVNEGSRDQRNGASASISPGCSLFQGDRRPAGLAKRTCWLGKEDCTDGVGYRPTVSAGVFEAIGPRESMEDRSLSLEGWGMMLSPQRADVSLYAVFDGHRGAQAADYCKAHLPSLLALHLGLTPSPQQALEATFGDLERGFREVWEADRASRLAHGKPGGMFPGCTALVALLIGRDLYVANAGDCRAVLCRKGTGDIEAEALSQDHTAALEEERARIQRQGGAVSWQHNGWRIGGCGIQVSRSIGDFDQKHPTGGLTAEPEVRCFRLGPEDSLIVMGSDGLWDACGNEEACGLVRDTVKDPTLCAKRLVTEVLARGSDDNVTAIVVFLNPVSTLELVFGAGKQSHPITNTFFGSRKGASVNAASISCDEIRDMY